VMPGGEPAVIGMIPFRGLDVLDHRAHLVALMPPSRFRATPVIQRASSEAK